MTQLADLKPESHDLVVVPEDMHVPENPGFLVHKMKFLRTPSIIRSGSFNMAFLDAFRSSVVARWFGLDDPLVEPGSLRDIDFDGYVDMSTIRVKNIPSPQEVKSEIVTGYMTGGRLHPNALSTLSTQPVDGEAKFFRHERNYETINRLDGQQKVVSPKGGLTVYVELDPAHKTFAFSYALCHNNDNFDKKIARDIAKGRFNSEDWYEVGNYDENISVLANIKNALYNMFYGDEAGFTKQGAVFTSISEKVNYYELELIYERIKTI